MKRLFALLLMAAMLLCNACGSASSPSGGGDSSDPGGGGGGGNTNVKKTFTFRVAGYTADSDPVLHVAATGVAWDPGVTFNQVGTIQVEVQYLPQKVQVNVAYGDTDNPSWAVNSDGVCSGLRLWVNDVEITTWKDNGFGGKNYSFVANADGTITLDGEAFTSKDCSGGGGGGCTQRAMNFEFQGAASGSQPHLYCTGDGVNWEAHVLDSNGRVTINGCPANYRCNVEFLNGSWATANDGVCNEYHLLVNSTEVTTWASNINGDGNNFSFNLTDTGAITGSGTTITRKDCTGGGGGTCTQQTLDFEFRGAQAASNPTLFCNGDGMAWQPHLLDANGRYTATVCADTYGCNVQFSDGSWAAAADGVCNGYQLLVNGSEVTTWENNSSGDGKNYSFILSDSGAITANGSAITRKDCSGGGDGTCTQRNLVFHLAGYASGTSPQLNCTGDGLIWTPHTLDANGRYTTTGCAATYQCNVEFADHSWAVSSDGVCEDLTFSVNETVVNTWVDSGFNSRNYSFVMNDSGAIVQNGTLFPTKDCSGDGGTGCTYYNLNFEFSGYTTGDNPQLYCSGDGMAWQAHSLDANGQFVTTACAAMFQCNVLKSDGTWVVGSDGVWAGYTFKVNTLTITTGFLNSYGGTNYSFQLNADASVALYGTQLVTYSDEPGGDGGGTDTCSLEFEYKGVYANPILHVFGGGLNWNVPRILVADGDTLTTTLQGIRGTYLANMDMLGNATLWLASSQGILANEQLYLNGVLLDHWQSTTYGPNLTFVVNEDCSVTFP